MKKIIFALLTTLFVFSGASYATSGDHGDHAGLTWETVDPHAKKTIVYQVINVAIFGLILTVLVRKKINAALSAKKETYHEAIKRVERARAEATQKSAELKTRLDSLESTSSDALARAQKEAEELHAKILGEANNASKNLRDEALRVANTETLRAIQNLRAEVVDKALSGSRTVLQEKMKDQDQRRLQREFVEKIQVVQR